MEGRLMVGILTKPDTHEKLEILSADAQYDLACACGSNKYEHRKRGKAGWIYPVTLPNGGTSLLFKTLLSNICTNDCTYCPLRENQDIRRCSLTVEETADAFLDYYNRGEVFGLFLSSSVIGSPESTMDRLCGVAEILRKKRKFRGYIHLKVIPGCSAAAIEKAISLSTAVSLNIETPGAEHLANLSKKKNFMRDIIEPIKLISTLTAKGNRYHRVKQTTQFIIGAANESDSEIVKYTWGLYKRLNLNRVYYTAYQKHLGDDAETAENKSSSNFADFTREHRLYQVDFLMRKYGFTNEDIICDSKGNLSLEADPKQIWADNHPEVFPLKVNSASKTELLKVPGLGPVTVEKILNRRRSSRLNSIKDIGKPNVRLKKAASYLDF
jgi:predicted DNA-binding helix-hairpin-helix protein